MEVRSYDGVFKYFKVHDIEYYDLLYQAIGLKEEYADWLFHIIHNDFDENDLAKKFGIDEDEAFQFLEVSGDCLKEFMQKVEGFIKALTL